MTKWWNFKHNRWDEDTPIAKATAHPSPRHLTQSWLLVSVEKDSNGRHYVHVRKNPNVTTAVGYGRHPVMTPNEAEALARDVGNAAAEARRKDVAARV